jgi:hypothetical protein
LSEVLSLRILWEKYKVIERNGTRTSNAKTLEEQIHARQKEMGSAPYDFDARWDRNRINATPSVSGPPHPDAVVEKPKVPQVNFTLEQAVKIVGENDVAQLRDCAKFAECWMIILADELDKINPLNANVARRGQATNVALVEFRRRKENPNA